MDNEEKDITFSITEILIAWRFFILEEKNECEYGKQFQG